MHTQIAIYAAALISGIGAAPSLHAQESKGLKRKVLQTFDIPGANFEAIIGTSELAPNETSGRQCHPGPESGYVLRGSGTIFVDGQPPLALKTGQSYKLAPGAVHDVRSDADGINLVVTWVVEKGKPFVSPAR